jgi:hypothetical protein
MTVRDGALSPGGGGCQGKAQCLAIVSSSFAGEFRVDRWACALRVCACPVFREECVYIDIGAIDAHFVCIDQRDKPAVHRNSTEKNDELTHPSSVDLDVGQSALAACPRALERESCRRETADRCRRFQRSGRACATVFLHEQRSRKSTRRRGGASILRRLGLISAATSAGRFNVLAGIGAVCLAPQFSAALA